eukprot:jgi/Tetstr1/454122/TSEL_041041.t1
MRVVVTRPGANLRYADVYEGWDGAARQRVVVKRHHDDRAARRDFAALERVARCDRALVVGAAAHRLLFDAEIEFGAHAAGTRARATDHPNIVVHTHPGTLACFDPAGAGPADRHDGDVSEIVRPLLAAVRELHARSALVHCHIGPRSVVTMPSGRCTLTGLENSKRVGETVTRREPGTAAAHFERGPAHTGMDMWACGILLFQAAHPRPRGDQGRDEVLVRNILTTGYRADMWRNADAPAAADLCAALLSSDRRARPGASEALEHDLFSARPAGARPRDADASFS